MTSPRRAAVRLCAVALLAGVRSAAAHPLGNFTINHYARVEVGAERLDVRYVIDLAEIPTFQEVRGADADGDGSLSPEERAAYLERVVARTIEGIDLSVDGIRVALAPVTKTITMVPGAGGLPTLRVAADLAGTVPGGGSSPRRRVRFVDANDRDRIGWHELVVVPGAGIAIFDSSAFGSGLTDELKAYPTELLMAPLNERSAEWSFTLGASPAGSTPLRTRDGRAATPARDRLAALIALPELTLPIVLAALLIAAALGGLHALSPGHGKTIVGAYLVGSRGTARHAVFLGATVTVTHTLGVFGLGFVTLFASHYIRPERLFPILSLISGGRRPRPRVEPLRPASPGRSRRGQQRPRAPTRSGCGARVPCARRALALPPPAARGGRARQLAQPPRARRLGRLASVPVGARRPARRGRLAPHRLRPPPDRRLQHRAGGGADRRRARVRLCREPAEAPGWRWPL